WPVVNVGGFDESFFMYFEEVDLAYRLALAGWEVRYAPDAVVDHVSGASTAQCRTRMLVQHYASCARFYDRYYSAEVRDRWLRIMRLKMRLRRYRDVARLRVTRDAARLQQIREQIA